MALREPAWWYRAAPTMTARALRPAADIWGELAVFRYDRKQPFDPGLPVVCVGNFTAGGTGKTPLALRIARELERLGARPAFLSRGYGGRISGPHWVAPGRDRAADVGDEPLLLAAAAPVMIARDRAEGARAIVATGARHGAIVMDDGLQNPGLAKSLSIAVVDGRRGIGNGEVIPAGPLRAPLAFQLALVDAVVVNAPDDAAGRETGFADWLRHNFGGPVISAVTGPSVDTAWLHEAPVLAYCGIGAPERFFGLLQRLGARLAAARAFADHHAFTEADARGLLAEADRLGARLCTTEKDYVRLAGVGACEALRARSRALPIMLRFSERDELRLKGLLEASLAGRGGNRLGA